MNDIARPVTRAEADRIIRDAREASHPIPLQSGDAWRITTRLGASDVGYTPVAAIETGGLGGLVLVDPATGYRLQASIPTDAAGEPWSIYDAMRRLIDIAEARDFLNEEGASKTPDALPANVAGGRPHVCRRTAMTGRATVRGGTLAAK
jgi:hypothetical protein